MNSPTPSSAELGQAQVLHHDDPVLDVEGLGHDEGLLGVLGRHRPVAPGVAAGDRRPAVHEPLGQRQAGARLAGRVGLVVDAPPAAPAGVEQHAVAGLDGQALALQGVLGVVGGDDLAGLQARDLPDAGDVQQQAAGQDLGQGLDAQPVGAVLLDQVVDAVAVVGPVADLQVVEAVEVGAHLRGGRHLLDDPVDALRPRPSAPPPAARRLTWCAEVVRYCRKVRPGKAGRRRPARGSGRRPARSAPGPPPAPRRPA